MLSIYSDEKTTLALQEVKKNYKNNTKYLFSGYFFYERQIKLFADGDIEGLLNIDGLKIDWRAEARELRKQVKAQSAQLDILKEMLSQILTKLPV